MRLENRVWPSRTCWVPLNQPRVDGAEIIWDNFPLHCFFIESLLQANTTHFPTVFPSKSLLEKSRPHRVPWRLHAMQPLWMEEYKRVRGSKLTIVYEEPARSCIKYSLAYPKANVSLSNHHLFFWDMLKPSILSLSLCKWAPEHLKLTAQGPALYSTVHLKT